MPLSCRIFILKYSLGIIYQLSDDSVLAITCTYDDECATEDIIIYAESGYKVLITVKEVDIDGTSGDFLLIKSGKFLLKNPSTVTMDE